MELQMQIQKLSICMGYAVMFSFKALKLQGIEKIKAAAESHKLFIALGFYRSF